MKFLFRRNNLNCLQFIRICLVVLTFAGGVGCSSGSLDNNEQLSEIRLAAKNVEFWLTDADENIKFSKQIAGVVTGKIDEGNDVIINPEMTMQKWMDSDLR